MGDPLACKSLKQVGFEVLTAMVTKSAIFWDVTPFNQLKVNRCFGEMYRVLLQSKNSASKKQA
jgi:hypothetical protein